METIDEVREFIKVNKVKPSDLFSVDNLTEEPLVKEFFKDDKSRAVSAEWEHRTRTEKKMNEMKADYEKQLSDLKAANAKTAKEAAKAKVPEIISKLAKDRKLDESQVKFINARVGKFEPKEPEKLEAELNAHLDAEIDEYKKTAEIFGIKQEVKKEDGDKTGNTGAGADQTSHDASPDKYLNPATNPLIPQI